MVANAWSPSGSSRRERREPERVRIIDIIQSQADPMTVNIERRVESIIEISGNPDRSSEMPNLSRVPKIDGDLLFPIITSL
jgi:hypothetical protein